MCEARPAAIGIAARLLTAAASVLALPLVMTRLSAAEQGYHYTFFSLLAAQTLIELGLSSVLLQAIAHEAADATGDRARLARIIRFAIRWYAIAGLGVGALLGGVGTWFLAANAQADGVAWRGPWLLLAAGSVASVWVVGLLSVLEGFGRVGTAALLRLGGGVLSSGLFIILLWMDFRLWATALQVAVSSVAMCLAGVVALRGRIAPLLQRGAAAAAQWCWRSEILPMQWRIALSFLSGWLIFQLMTPAVMSASGAEAAGRFGLGLALTGGVLSLSDTIVQVRFPAWGRLVAAADWPALDADFVRTAARAVGAYVAMAMVLIVVVWFVHERAGVMAARLPDLTTIIALCVAALSNQWAFVIARYLRAHRRDPFMGVSLAYAAVVTAACAFDATRDAQWLPVVFMAASVVILTGVGTVCWWRCRLEWHAR